MTYNRHFFVSLFAICALFMLVACSGGRARSGDYFPDKQQEKLARAAARGDTKAIDKILSNGIDINYQGKDGMTALIWAFTRSNKKGFEYLLERGANPNLFMDDGWSAMELCTMHEDIWYLKTVIKYGGDVNLVDPQSHETPLITSMTPHRFEHVRLLINSGANLDYQGAYSATPMIRAAWINQYDLVYLLIESGADPKIKDRWGCDLASYIMDSLIDQKSDGYQWLL